MTKRTRPMISNTFTVDDIDTIENGADSPFDYYASVQRAINEGLWSLQGSYGRTMMDAIQEGYCLLGRNSARDYWGNYIPARFEVMPGSPGSLEHVAARCDDDWAQSMAQIGAEG